MKLRNQIQVGVLERDQAGRAVYGFKNADQFQFTEAWDLFEEVRSYDG